jgi:hypothetical protein
MTALDEYADTPEGILVRAAAGENLMIHEIRRSQR